MLSIFLAIFTIIVISNNILEYFVFKIEVEIYERLGKLSFILILSSLFYISKYKYFRYIKHISVVTINLIMLFIIAHMEGSSYVPRCLFLVVPVIFSVIFLENKVTVIISLFNISVPLSFGLLFLEHELNLILSSVFYMFVVFSLILLLSILKERMHEENIILYTTLRENISNLERSKNIELMTEGIFHDVKNDLSVIYNVSSLLRKDIQNHPENQNLLDKLDLLDRSSVRTIELFRKVIGLGSQKKVEIRRDNISELLDAELKFIRLIVGSEIRIHSSLDPNPPMIDLNRNYLLQILINICLNAKDAIERAERINGTIRISTQEVDIDEKSSKANMIIPEGKYIELCIRDNGTGIEKDDLELIFDPFYTTKENGGSGLGLMMVRSLLEEMGAYVDVESVTNRGTEFLMYFPINNQGN